MRGGDKDCMKTELMGLQKKVDSPLRDGRCLRAVSTMNQICWKGASILWRSVREDADTGRAGSSETHE